MNIGPLSLPIGPIIFFLSVAIAVFASWLVDERRKDTEPAVFTAVINGLIVARISFVLHYLPSYRGSVFQMFDFRDSGFEIFPGVIAGLIIIGFILARRKSIRRRLSLDCQPGAWLARRRVSRVLPPLCRINLFSTQQVPLSLWRLTTESHSSSIFGLPGALHVKPRCRCLRVHRQCTPGWIWSLSIKGSNATPWTRL
jgi:hypothetical protein